MAASRHIEQLACEKEQELVSLRQQHAQLVQETLKSVDNELVYEQQRLQKLQADFEYNLSLLEQRDTELSHYDSAFLEVRKVVNALTAENSELKVRVDSLHGEIAHHKESYDQLKVHYIRRIEELQTQTDAYRRLKDVEVEKEREKLEQSQRKLQQHLLENDLASQQQREQIAADFDQLMRQKDHEHQLKVDELNAIAMKHETQARQLLREVKVYQSTQETRQQERKGREEDVRKLEKQLKQSEWEREDAERMADARMKELESKLTQTQSMNNTLQDDFVKRHSEMDRLVREKESGLQAAKEAHCEREVGLEKSLRDLQARLESKDVDVRRLQWAHKDALAERDSKLERLEQQSSEVRAQAKARVDQLVKDSVAKDLQIQSLQDTSDKLRHDAARSSDNLKHCQQELSLSVERERSLQQAQAQLQLDWEHRIEQVERQAYSKHQEIIQKLTSARNQAQGELKETQQTLSQQSSALQAVQRERDVAIASLSRQGLTEECNLTDERDIIQQLKQRNDELHMVIAQMRQEMEQLTETKDSTQTSEDKPLLTVGYVQYMEGEVMQLKSEKNQLQEQVRELLAAKKPPTPQSKQSTPPHPPSVKTTEQQHRGHLVALSDTIATLQREKTQRELECLQLRSTVKKLEALLKHSQEKVYVLKACQVPQSKLHQKLLCATQVIISLVKEKEMLTQQLKLNSPGRRDPKKTEQSVNDTSRLKTTEQQLMTGAATTPSPDKTRKQPPLVLSSEETCHPQEISQPTSTPRTNSSTEHHVTAAGNLEQLSLNSLRFSESSDDHHSVEKLFEMVDRGDIISSTVPLDPAPRPLPLTQTSPPHQSTVLELQGKPARTHSRALVSRNNPTARRKQVRTKSKARNYNVKD